MSDEERKPFTVTDRRHFTAEGEPRKDEDEPAAAARPSAPSPPPAPPSSPAPPPRPEAAGAARRPAPRSAPAGTAERPPGAPIDFIGLLLSLGAQAGYLLGAGRGDEAQEAPDPEGARAIIALLEVLKDKTEGRRTPEEDEVIEGILYELRMEFVARTRVSGR